MSTSETKQCQNCKSDFTIEPEDFAFYEKIKVPPPTFCPECRYKRRLLDRNEWSLYHRRCDFTGEDIISIYRPDAPFPVYKQEIWKSDVWDPLKYGQEFDFDRSFFEQYEELRRRIPHLSLVNSNSINSEYSNQSQDNKDCYMVSASGGSEKCMYGNWFQPGNYFSADCYMIEKGELCYECVNCGRCHSCVWCQDCFDCVSCSFSTDLHGCSNCFGCIGLRNKQYCWFNRQLSKEAYEAKKKSFLWSRDTIVATQKEAARLTLVFPRKYYHGTKNNDSTGDYLGETEATRFSFNVRRAKDNAYLQDSWKMRDCLDTTEILDAELSHEIQGCAYIARSAGLRSCWNMNNCYYCDMCFSCENCLGCFGLRQKSYCILNKQYSKDDYTELKNKIIEHMKKTGEWGEYFPVSISPFAYNESTAQDYFPLSKEEALAKGYAWYDHPGRNYKPTLKSENLPSTIMETSDDILKQVIECDSQTSDEKKERYQLCTTAFQIIPLELELYHKMNLPLPKKCFPCRRTDRFTLRNQRKLWHRKCTCTGEQSENGVYKNTATHRHGVNHCPEEFETSYAPERPEIVYCEGCYRAEVV